MNPANNPATISVAIITKDESKDIGACLESVAGWTAEVVVVDSGSTDGTQDICRRMGAKVIETSDWPGFGAQKNRALAACSGEWILSLDADESVPPQLREEILKAVRVNAHGAYRMPRLSSFCGRNIYHGGWWPDYVLRLFRRDNGRFSDDRVHERVLVTSSVGTLGSPIHHRTLEDLDESLAKMNHYTSEGAAAAYTLGKRSGLSGAVLRGLWAFFRSYVLRRGFLDGRHGFVLAVLNAESTYYRQVKLWLKDVK